MPGRTAAFTVNFTGVPELQARLKNISERLSKRWIRGAVAEGANVIRDQAKANAISQGLAVSGRYPTTPGGRVIDHRGMIPFAIRSWVDKPQGRAKATAGVRVVSGRRKSPTQTYHWHFVEYGGPNNPVTRPFWQPAIAQTKATARAAAIEVVERNVRLYGNK
jgi:HK97 gp10 family phage protein